MSKDSISDAQKKAIISAHMADMSARRKTIGGFTNPELARKAAAKSVEARRKKREDENKEEKDTTPNGKGQGLDSV